MRSADHNFIKSYIALFQGYFYNKLAKRFTLNKNERLKSRKRIEEVFTAGNNFFIYPIKTQFILSSPGKNATALQVGIAVSARNFKKAVERNRIKRLIREVYRLQKHTLQQKLEDKQKCLQVFFVYVGKEIPVFAQLHEKLRLILERLIQKVDEKNTPNT